MADPRIGQTLGRYEIEAVLGRGGMGVVYQAQQPFPRRKVALKLLPPDFAEDDESRRRFLRESEMAAAIDHPHIIPIYEAGEVDGVLYIAMRLVKGTDLHSLIQQGGALPVHRTLALLEQAGAALDAAHEEGLVHRDVKPANILITGGSAGTREHVYLTDFGLTKRVDASSGLTRTGQVVGSLNYMAPEQIRGEILDGRADIYSLGCVLVECVTGSPPFLRDSEVATMYAHLQDDPPRVTSLRSDLPNRVDAVVNRALEKQPNARFESCGAFLEQLSSAVDTDGRPEGTLPTLPLPTRPAMKPYTGPRFLRRFRGVALLLGALVLLAGTGVGGYMIMSSSPDTTKPVQEAESPSPTASDSPTPESTSSPTGTEPSGVIAERQSPSFRLFDGAIDAETPWVNEIQALYEGYPLDHVISEATLLGAWWALADWCETSGRNLESCYDLAAEYISPQFERDPRTINDDTWSQPGAIGAIFTSSYDTTASYIGLPASDLIPDLVADRPGVDWLCEPSCVAAPHE